MRNSIVTDMEYQSWSHSILVLMTMIDKCVKLTKMPHPSIVKVFLQNVGEATHVTCVTGYAECSDAENGLFCI